MERGIENSMVILTEEVEENGLSGLKVIISMHVGECFWDAYLGKQLKLWPRKLYQHAAALEAIEFVSPPK